ncbi:hypothetical protein F4561_005235 [Lipingzhangella halophila]|uniref:Uncharacterized protein n=1 Tax=Lipingzhangella halophila TaxID=1783352 RepID=A0A7W7RLX2_9ACTN|nr:hypothetical protein [Lipingzhangella halophila]
MMLGLFAPARGRRTRARTRGPRSPRDPLARASTAAQKRAPRATPPIIDVERDCRAPTERLHTALRAAGHRVYGTAHRNLAVLSVSPELTIWCSPDTFTWRDAHGRTRSCPTSRSDALQHILMSR